jgi:hypothetical protein
MKSAKVFIAILLALVMAVSFALPALADTVTSTGTVGSSGGNAPYMLALTMTPDEVNGASDGINILPEAAKPTFNANTPSTTDGWKEVNFYLIADVASGGWDNPTTGISGMSVDVNYPSTVNDGARKFEIDLVKTGVGDGITALWSASQTGYAPENYPAMPLGTTPVAAIPPQPNTQWTARQILSNDIVDVNANEIGDSPDMSVQSFLTNWGTRVSYGTNPVDNSAWNAGTTYARLQSGEAVMIEVQGWIWFHQNPVIYTVSASATNGSGTPVALSNTFQFVPTTSLYLDFTSINYGTFNANQGEILVQGDADLSTSGAPTIWDNGNVDAQVTLNSTKMVLNGVAADYNDPSKTISQFDAALYYKDGSGNNIQVGYIKYAADTPTLIANNMADTTPVAEMGITGAVLLQACHPAKIDFSIFPQTYIKSGPYTGTTTITLATYLGAQPEVP